MAKTFTDHRALVLSYELREAMLGVINPGIYCGFDTIVKTSTGFSISHEKTGIVKTLVDWSMSNPTGVYMNKYGTLVHEEGAISVNVPGETKEGLYILVAYYQRPYVGTDVPVRFEITYTLRAAENVDDLSALNQYDTPLMTIRISGTGAARTYSMGAVPGSADMKSTDVLSADDVTAPGVRGGLGKFKELGRILKYLDTWLKEKDRLDLNVIAKLGIPDYTGKEDPNNPGELPNTYNFIGAVYTMWYNLYIIDTQLKKLWDKLGFPEKQPEGETVLNTLKTIWENFVALKKYLNDEDTKIWNRIGYPDKNPAGVNWISIAKTVWNNLLSLDTELKRYEVQTDADLKSIHDYIDGPLAQDLSTIYSTMGYKLNGSQTEPAMTSVSKTKSIWTNLVDLQNELQNKYDDLNQSNDFKIYMPTLNLSNSSTSPTELPAAEVYKAMIVDMKYMTRNGVTGNVGFVKLPSDNRADHNQVLFLCFGENWANEGLDGKGIVVTGLRAGDETITVELYTGGWVLVSKKAGESFWRIHAREKGRLPSANVTPGLMAGTEIINGNQIHSYSNNTQWIIVSNTIGISYLDYQPLYDAARNKFGWSGNIGNGNQRYGNHRSCLMLDPPTEDMEGYEKVIKLIGNISNSLWQREQYIEGWTRLLFHIALPNTIVDPSSDLNTANNGPHRPYLKYVGDWIRVKAMNWKGAMKWVLVDNGFASPIQLLFSSVGINTDKGGFALDTYNILTEQSGGTFGRLQYMVGNTYNAYKDAWGNGMGLFIKEDVLHMQLSIQCWKSGKSASGGYWFNPCVPPVAGDKYLQFCDSRGSSGLQWYIHGRFNESRYGYRNEVVVNDIDNGVFNWEGTMPLMMGAACYSWTIYQDAPKNY